MKTAVLAFLCLIGPIALPLSAADRFYGKITDIDAVKKNITLHNNKQNMDARFQWSDQTAVTSGKKSLPVTELKVGQSLMVSYVTENDLNKAQKILVRKPFKKSVQ